MSTIETNSSLDAVVRDYAFPDIHIGASEEESPWVPFKGNTTFIRHLAFDVRSNMYADVFSVTPSRAVGGIWNTTGSPALAAMCRRVPARFTRLFQTKA